MRDRILVINPNSTLSCTQGIDVALAGLRAPGLPAIEVMQLDSGPPAIVTWRDWFAVAGPLCDLVQAHPAAAYVIACVSDPGVDAARTVTRAPVFGPLRSAIAAALARADRFGIVAFGDASIARQRRTMAAMGVEARLAGHVPLNLPMDTLTHPSAARPVLRDVVKRVAAEGAEAIVLGCAGLAAHRAFAEDVAGVPVIEPCQAAVALALQAVIAARPVLAQAAE